MLPLRESSTGERLPLSTHLQERTLSLPWMTGCLPSNERPSGTNGVKVKLFSNYLHGRALQKWNLMDGSEKVRYDVAVSALQSRLEHGNKTLAAQDLCHIAKMDDEKVATFIRRLERMFNIAYGHNAMSTET